MASTAEVSPDTLYADYPGAMRRPLLPTVRWGAVLAGVAVGISIQLALTLLGIASGLSSAAATPAHAAGILALAWTGISMLIAAFAGGYVAARMSGLKRTSDGVLHGMVCWAVTTLLFAALATSAGGAMVSGLFSGMPPASVAASANRPAAGASASGGELGAMLRRQIGGYVSPDALQSLIQSIRRGQRDQAISQMVDNIGVDEARAASVVDQALILSGSPRSASPAARVRAEKAADAAGAAVWAVFFSVALSLFLGIAGGALGAMGSRRTTWVTRVPDDGRPPAPSTSSVVPPPQR